MTLLITMILAISLLTAANAGNKSGHKISVESLGLGRGDAQGFFSMISWIKHKVPPSKIITYVHGECYSACIYLYMLGGTRLASSTATFGFHAARNSETRELFYSGNEDAESLVRLGIREDFVTKMAQRGTFKNFDILPFSGELELSGSNIVHMFVDLPYRPSETEDDLMILELAGEISR